MATAPARRQLGTPVDPAVQNAAQRCARTGTQVHVCAGNLAPAGCVLRYPDGTPPPSRGVARVFGSVSQAIAAVQEWHPGDFIVVRYEDPTSAASCTELEAFAQHVQQQGLHRSVLCISDGGFPLALSGPVLDHVTPSAAQGGPLALVRDGDLLMLDLSQQQLKVQQSDEHIAKRRMAWRLPGSAAAGN